VTYERKRLAKDGMKGYAEKPVSRRSPRAGVKSNYALDGSYID
jgi:hypothetical protein